MGEGLLDCAGLLGCVSTALKKEKKIKSTMFLFLCVFGGLARYDEGSRWDNFWDGKNMSNLMKIFQGFMNHISIKWLVRGILKRWGDEEIIWNF